MGWGILSDHLSCQSDLTYLWCPSWTIQTAQYLLCNGLLCVFVVGFYVTCLKGRMVSGVQAWQACPHNVSLPIAVWCRETRSDCSKK